MGGYDCSSGPLGNLHWAVNCFWSMPQNEVALTIVSASHNSLRVSLVQFFKIGIFFKSGVFKKCIMKKNVFSKN